MKSLPTLYKIDKSNRIQQWTISIDSDNGSYSVTEGLMNGKLTTTKPHTCDSKNLGKKNETSAADQALKEAQAKHKNKLEHGYSLSIADTHLNTYREPMLAHQFEDYRHKISYPVYVDAKLNGMRCNALQNSVKSRKGKTINTIPHIQHSLKPLFDKYPDMYLDGELYNDKFKNNLNQLIELTSVAYKPSDLTPELLKSSAQIVEFHVYDGFGFKGITQNTAFVDRRSALKQLLKNVPSVSVLNYTECANEKEVYKLLSNSKREKREGIIIRWGTCGYEFKRSKYLLKLKNFVSEEFAIVDIQEGNGDWAGCASRIVLQLPKPVIGRDGKLTSTFDSNIEGKREWRAKLYRERASVVGELATCEYQELSEYGIPQIGYVRSIRNYE
jgi:DNA ligase-1